VVDAVVEQARARDRHPDAAVGDGLAEPLEGRGRDGGQIGLVRG
jgi:hypothetical protein